MKFKVTLELEGVTLAEAERDIVARDVLDLVLLANGQAAVDVSLRGLQSGTRVEVRNPRTRQTVHHWQQKEESYE